MTCITKVVEFHIYCIHMWLGCGYKLKKKFIMIERYLNPNVNIINIDTCISKICKKTPYKYYTIC